MHPGYGARFEGDPWALTGTRGTQACEWAPESCPEPECPKCPKAPQKPGMEASFRRLDKNSDGVLSMDEYLR